MSWVTTMLVTFTLGRRAVKRLGYGAMRLTGLPNNRTLPGAVARRWFSRGA